MRLIRKGLLVEIYAILISIFCSFLPKVTINALIVPLVIKHKNLFYFFPKYLSTHLGNTLLLNNTPYKTYLNPPFNAIFVEFYEDLPKEDNCFMKIFFPYLEFLHYSKLSIPTFVEFYPFGTIRSLKENNVRFQTLVDNAPWPIMYFCKNHSTFLICSPNFIFCSFLPILSWIFQSH